MDRFSFYGITEWALFLKLNPFVKDFCLVEDILRLLKFWSHVLKLCALSISLAANSTCSSKQFSRLCYSAAAGKNDCCCWGQRVCNDFLGVIFQQGDGKCVWSKKFYGEVTKTARRYISAAAALAAAFVPIFLLIRTVHCSLTILLFHDEGGFKGGQVGGQHSAFRWLLIQNKIT